MKRIFLFAAIAAFTIAPACSCQRTEDNKEPEPETFEIENLPEMVEIPEGTFTMGTAGSSGFNYDEAPAHSVTVSAFSMSKYEITNKQFEEFRPEHVDMRKDEGFSSKDDDAVINVTWEDAVAYCKWLSQGTGENYRLPTEAEWEYACRAGTTSAYYTGASLPEDLQKQQKNNRDIVWVSLEVGKTTPNAWGLYDMHGNVEEWCLDWYGPYKNEAQTDPAGPSIGLYRVTRGGSHNTPVEFLRSANRSAATPDAAHNMLGFRVVKSDTKAADLETYPAADYTPRYAKDVKQGKASWGNVSSSPVFEEPVYFAIKPTDGTVYYSHNHQPAVTWCDNGDLLAIWYTCEAEAGREMEVVASRLRSGASEWEPASFFFKVPDRNMTGSSLLRLSDGALIHMNGVGRAGEWQNLALCARRSSDNGATWSDPVLVEPRHVKRHQVISGPIVMSDGTLVQLCDAEAGGSGGTSIHISEDNGLTWADQWDGSMSFFIAGESGSSIAGIHAQIVELKDGSLMAFGRGNAIGGKMPCSISKDKGKTWTYSASPFPPIGSGQRHVLLRLNEGPIMLASFSGSDKKNNAGIFVSISEDEGKNWSTPKLLTDGKTRTIDGGAHTGTFTMSATQAEPAGYFCGTQTPDGTIHLLSSAIHYRFNLSWIKAWE